MILATAPVVILSFYGFFLITCGMVSVGLIGRKAKTALASGGTSAMISLGIAYLISNETKGAQLAGLIVSAALFVVFAWRSAKTLFRIFELVPLPQNEELKGKGIAFLIISLMAIVSVFVFVLQLIYY